MMQKILAARELFLQESFGVLSTISVDVPGYPFGSVAPYCADEQCRPIIYISYIAQHTKNIMADSRVSLTILENDRGSDDVQARGRVTVLGRAQPVNKNEPRIPDRYFRYFPSSRQYEQTHDFAFFRLEPERIRFIGGFGEIYWVEPADFMIANPFSAAEESRIVQHMNNDHSPALQRCSGGAPAVMTGIDAGGFDVFSGGRKRRFVFQSAVHNLEEARQELIRATRSV